MEASASVPLDVTPAEDVVLLDWSAMRLAGEVSWFCRACGERAASIQALAYWSDATTDERSATADGSSQS